MQQPPPQDSTNQSGQLWQSSYPPSEPTIPPQTLPIPSQPLLDGTLPQNYGQGEHPGEEPRYGMVPPPPPGNYPPPYYPNPDVRPGQPKRRNGMAIVVLVLLALVIILGATTVLALRRAGVLSVATAPTATSQTGAGQATSVPPTATSSASGAATSTPVPSPSATAQSADPVANGTITENLLLTCGTDCSDPIRVTITNVQVDGANGRMIWNISLKNITGSSIGYGIDTFELLASGTQTQIPATFSQSGGTLTNNDPVSTQGIFAFVPTQNTTYTLTAVVEENPYGGPQITFDPAQITNL